MDRTKLVLFLIFLFILFLHPLEGDGDFYHHINTGRYVLTHFQLPKLNEWTFTEYGKSWIAHSWAAGVLFYLIYSTFGVFGISIFVALVGLITLYLAYLLVKSYQLKESFIYPILLLLTSLLLVRFPARPEIFAYPFLISILLIDRLSTNSPKLTRLYPLIIFLWSIFYGANVLLGLGLLIFLTIAHYARKVGPYEARFVLLSMLVSLSNGYGLDTIFYIFKISQISQVQGEWLGIFSIFQRASPEYLYLFKFRLIIYAMFLILTLILTITHLKLIRKNLREFILTLTIFLPILTFRQVGLAAILSLPFLSVILKNNFFLWILSILSIFITLFYNPPRLEFTESPARIKLVSFITKSNLSGNAYTNQQLGSYISFKFYPKILVSYDTRDDLFMGGRFLKDSTSGVPVELLLQRYKADLVILDVNEDMQKVSNLLHSPNWIKVYFQDNFLVMKRV